MNEEQINELIEYNLDYSIEEDLEETKKCLKEANKEIERLNNIINELEKWAKEELEQPNWASCGARYMLDKLQELKDSDKE